MFPQLNEFLDGLKKSTLLEDEEKWEFYRDNCSSSFVMGIIGDHTCESMGEDESEWVRNQTPESLWHEMFHEYAIRAEREFREKVPIDVVKKYLDEEELEELKFIEETKIVNAI